MRSGRTFIGVLGISACGILGCGLLIAGSSQMPAQREPGPVVKTDAGGVEGVTERGVIAFKGIPYAAPPIGELRWREPQPRAAWSGVRPADRYSDACIQTPGLSAANGGDPGPLSEDCLYLNVWTPKLDPSAKLPVMVWIHGGAYVFGAGGMPIYEGAPLAHRGAVAVTLNYRLGQLGFFAHPALEKSNPNGPANFGLLDQIFALQWVQRNIAQFGGDPGNVTILGQSAGAKSVLALFASPMARGLFHKGIAMSSYGLPDVTRAKAIEAGTHVATALGLKGADATLAELRAVPAARFGSLKGQAVSTSPVPISGDPVLPQSVQDTFAAGTEAPLPLIVGNTSDDASVVVAFGVDPAKVIASLRSAGVFVKLLYPGIKDDAELGRQVARDLVFTMPARFTADRHSKLAPTWRYYFDYTAVKERARFPHGVPHGGEIVYALDTGEIYGPTRKFFTDEDRAYAERVSDYWFEFARTGEPSARGGPSWGAHSDKQDRTVRFGPTMVVENNFMKARLNTFIGGIKVLGSIANRK